MPPSLSSKVAIVTGAAGGIGQVTAHHLSDLGASVVVADVDGEAAREVAESLVSEGRPALGVLCDLGEERDVEALVKATLEAFGGLDLLDHNAAWTSQRRDTDATTIDLDVWERALRINARGGLLLARHAVAHMVDRGGGAIVNISSGSSMIGTSGRLAYGVSKAAVNQLTRHLAARYGPSGVRANAVAPGFVLTPAATGAITGELRELLVSRTPSGRLGTPIDIAQAVAFLLSDEASFINGQVISVDGGLSMAGTLPIG